MESQQIKRKHQDELEENPMNKKQHSDSEITFTNIGADSTHVEDVDESALVKTLMERETKKTNEKGERKCKYV